MITKLQLNHFTGTVLGEKYYSILVSEMAKNGINTKLRECAFLAQILHESGGFRSIRENLNYDAEGLMKTWPSLFHTIDQANALAHQPYNIATAVYGREGNKLGNIKPTDGYFFRGGGPMGITGRANYTLLAHDTMIDFVNHPELIETPENYIMSAIWFWNKFNLNQYADTGNFFQVTQHINGGQIGAPDRQEKYNELLTMDI